MTDHVPRRIVLDAPERHFAVEYDMITAFFDSQNLKRSEVDFYTHVLFEPTRPSRLFFVLDLHCKAVPDVDLHKLQLQVYRVSKQRPLYVNCCSM